MIVLEIILCNVSSINQFLTSINFPYLISSAAAKEQNSGKGNTERTRVIEAVVSYSSNDEPITSTG